MSRLPTVEELERRTENYRRRRTAIQQRRAAGRPAGQTVTQRGPSSTYYYRSLLVLTGAAEHAVFTIKEPTAGVAAIGGAATAGLLTELGADTTLGSPRNRILVSRAHWYTGDATPTTQRSDWQTTWTRYYTPNSHQSAPLSRATGTFTARDIQTVFGALFGPQGTARAEELGGQNGRAYLRMETDISHESYGT